MEGGSFSFTWPWKLLKIRSLSKKKKKKIRKRRNSLLFFVFRSVGEDNEAKEKKIREGERRGDVLFSSSKGP